MGLTSSEQEPLDEYRCDTQRSMKTTMRIAIFTLTLFLLSYTSMFRQITVPNERTRIYLAVALVDDHALSIDGPVLRFGKTPDAAKFKGHYYTDKAPGTGLVAAVVYSFVRIFTPKESWSAESLIALMRFCVMIPFGMFGFLLLRIILRDLHLKQPIIDIVSVGWILGTSAFHYSTAFYGHQIAAVSMMLALYLQLKTGPLDSNATLLRRAILSGAAAGFSGLTEYQSIIPCGMLLIFTIWIHRKRPLGIFAFVLASLPFAVLLLAYNKLAFGGFFEVPYEHLALKTFQSRHSTGIGGVSIPRAAAVFGSLLSLHRGLIATSPVFLAVPFGLFFMIREKKHKLAILIGAMFLYYLWFIFSAEVWEAGWSFGPRLLVPMMGFAMIPTAFALQWTIRKPVWFGASVGCVLSGIVLHQLVHVVFPEPSVSMLNPILDLVVPAIKAGVLSPNRAAELTGFPGLWTIVFPFAATAAIVVILLSVAASELSANRKKIRHLATAIAAPAFLIAIILSVGPQISSKESKRFVSWMKKMEQAEFPSKYE